MGRRWLTRKGNYILKSNLLIGVQNMTLKSIELVMYMNHEDGLYVLEHWLWGREADYSVFLKKSDTRKTDALAAYGKAVVLSDNCLRDNTR